MNENFLKSPLGARIITGAALALVVMLLIVIAPMWLYALACALVMALAWREWHRLAPSGMVELVCVVAPCALGAAVLYQHPHHLPTVCTVGAVFWLSRAFFLAHRTPRELHFADWHGGLIFLFAWSALLWMQVEFGALATISMLLMIWGADSFAYLIGRKFGRRKLAPNISPNKTIEGALGGLIGAALLAAVSGVFVVWRAQLGVGAFFIWLLAGIVAALFCILGDLYESAAKRRAGVKHSGDLLPGHGGVLDRIDGMLAAAPAFACVWQWA